MVVVGETTNSCIIGFYGVWVSTLNADVSIYNGKTSGNCTKVTNPIHLQKSMVQLTCIYLNFACIYLGFKGALLNVHGYCTL